MAAASSAVEVGAPTGKLEVPKAVAGIAQRLEDNGFETWAVGGAVRDSLLGERRTDWDLATAARPEAVRKLFRPSYPIGIQFGTVGVRGNDGKVYEVTTFRRDLETDGRHAVVEYAERLDEDLARRDFTINAIAYHPLRHDFRDPYSGWDDLRNRVLRCVGDPALRFAEDYLRVLRGLRFAGRFSLEIDADTWSALVQAVPLLPRLSGERIREELLKVLSVRVASASLNLYRRSGALSAAFGELGESEEEEWVELLRAIDGVPARRLHLRLTLLFASAAEAAEGMMMRLRFSNAEIRDFVALSFALGKALPVREDVTAARRWLRAVRPERAKDGLRLHFARARGSRAGAAERVALAATARRVLSVIRRREPVTISHLAIDGDDLKALGLRPGPEFGRLLESCLDAVVEDPALNDRDRLLEHVRGQIE